MLNSWFEFHLESEGLDQSLPTDYYILSMLNNWFLKINPNVPLSMAKSILLCISLLRMQTKKNVRNE